MLRHVRVVRWLGAALLCLCAGLVSLTWAETAEAQNPVYQAYFFDVCSGSGSPSGRLARRCDETPGGRGDLSAASEESLNPSQSVSSSEGAIYRARAREDELRGKLEERRDDESDSDQSVLESGRFSLLANGRYSWFVQDETARQRGLDGDVWSIQLGGDFRLTDQWVVGAVLSYDRLDSVFDGDSLAKNFFPAGDAGAIDADSYSITGLASYHFMNHLEGLYVDVAMGYELTDYRFERQAIFQESTASIRQTDAKTRGTPDGHEFNVSGTAGYDFNVGALGVGPYARLSYVHSQIDSYRERDRSASGLNQRVDSQDRKSLVSTLGLRTNYALSCNWGVLIPQIRVEWAHEYRDERPKNTTRFDLDGNGTNLTIRGDRPDRNYFNVGASIAAVLPNGWIPFADYEGLLGYQHLTRHTVTVGLRKEF